MSEAAEAETQAKVDATVAAASAKMVDPPVIEKADATTEKAAEAAGFDSATHYKAYLDTLTDAERKDHAARFKSVDDILDGNLKQRKELSSRIKVPGKDATPEDVAAFRKAIGAKDKPEDYKAAVPEGYELGEPQQALLGIMQKHAAETGVPASSFEGFTKAYFEAETAVKEKIEAEVDQYRRDTDLALKKELGTDYQRHIRAAKDLVDNKLKIPEFTHLLEKKVQIDGVWMELGSHPDMIKTLAQIGLRAGEDGVIGHTSPDQRASIQDQINQLERKHPLGRRSREQDAQIAGLYKQLYN